MQNQQLVDYIKQQIAGGVSKDAITKALTDAGWSAADVNDSMQAAGANVSASVSPSTATNATAASTVKSANVNPMAAMGATSMGSFAKTGPSEKSFFTETKPASEMKTIEVSEKPASAGRMVMGIMGAVIVILLGALGYLYYSMNNQVAVQSSGTSSEVAGLNDQIKQLSNDKAMLTTQTANLQADNATLLSEVGFVAVTDSTSTVLTISIKGALNNTNGVYWLLTPHHLKVVVKNSKDAKVDATLKPLVGQNVELTGTHTPASTDLTVTMVNGAAPTMPTATASTTASTTAK